MNKFTYFMTEQAQRCSDILYFLKWVLQNYMGTT